MSFQCFFTERFVYILSINIRNYYISQFLFLYKECKSIEYSKVWNSKPMQTEWWYKIVLFHLVYDKITVLRIDEQRDNRKKNLQDIFNSFNSAKLLKVNLSEIQHNSVIRIECYKHLWCCNSVEMLIHQYLCYFAGWIYRPFQT